MEKQKVTTRKRKSSSQARGDVRRSILVNAGKELLATKPVEQLSLADVAKASDIPIGSVYHFFPKVNNLLAEISKQFEQQIMEAVFQPFSLKPEDNWQAIIRACVDRAVALYKENRAYEQLLIGGKTPAEIKFSDRENDEEIGRSVMEALNEHFVMMPFANQEKVFFHTVEIIDLMFMLSVNKHNEITDYMAEEAKRAAIAYLRCYMPEYLPKKADE
ncbi:TetR/AcrR family transcriptional regulator [Shewanella maritima]|uniref:TetR/AcrR family transcriptional regulator n=1 Tax=Shewanella maritima TaxID=2520507 RepID=UPI0013EEA7A9|nr:TetR/AcrR family transcriptional regulator [Shewanella maritima]